MTRAGLAALLAGAAALALGLWLRWTSFDLIGIGLLALVLGDGRGAAPVAAAIDREIQPPRVPKGSPAIAFLTFANRGRRTVGVTVANQPFGGTQVRTVIPKLRRGERGLRIYRLPTPQRGIFDIGPVEVTRRDPFELFRHSHSYGRAERIWVYPRLLGFRALPTGRTRHLEGPSSDTSPQGNITFHRLRDYVVGDDLRLVHWRSSARTGKLRREAQRRHVTAVQRRGAGPAARPVHRGVVRGGRRCGRLGAGTSSANKAPVELRLTDGTVIGGSRLRDVTPLIDHLTGVGAVRRRLAQAQLLALRRARSGTSLVVVTGVLDPADLPYVAALRRRFERLVLVSSTPTPTMRASAPPPAIRVPGVQVILARDADQLCTAWNARAAL